MKGLGKRTVLSLKRKRASSDGKVKAPYSLAAFDHGEAVILDLEGNRFYGLNESATFILNEIQTGKALSVIEQEYCDRYGIDEATASRDIAMFRQALVAKGLLRE